jgi:glycopeptide antibiotics resistance protein
MMNPARPRSIYALAVAGTIALGLGSRAVAAHLPWWLAKNAGDTLYATMVFFALGFAWPRMSTWRAAAIALAFSCAIEASQAYHAPWLDAVRATLPGHLVLGQGFHAFDLICYALGVALGVALEKIYRATTA